MADNFPVITAYIQEKRVSTRRTYAASMFTMQVSAVPWLCNRCWSYKEVQGNINQPRDVYKLVRCLDPLLRMLSFKVSSSSSEGYVT